MSRVLFLPALTSAAVEKTDGLPWAEALETTSDYFLLITLPGLTPFCIAVAGLVVVLVTPDAVCPVLIINDCVGFANLPSLPALFTLAGFFILSRIAFNSESSFSFCIW